MFRNQMKNSSYLHPYFIPLKWVCLRQYFITTSNTSKFIKNTILCVVFSTLFWMFDLAMKHSDSCLIHITLKLQAYYMHYIIHTQTLVFVTLIILSRIHWQLTKTRFYFVCFYNQMLSKFFWSTSFLQILNKIVHCIINL